MLNSMYKNKYNEVMFAVSFIPSSGAYIFIEPIRKV